MYKISFLTFVIILTSCSSHKYANDATNSLYNDTVTNNFKYFIGGGNEPFWDISISKENISFKSADETVNLTVPYKESVRAMDANVKKYFSKSDDGEISLAITQGLCLDNMSEIKHGYKIIAQVKNNNRKAIQTFEGCGNYILDYRLHDIWILQSINGIKINVADFKKQQPYLEINAKEKKFMGSGGCNSINGKLFSEDTLLRFTNVISTRMMCPASNIETDFLKALQSTTTFKIENNSLILTNPNDVKLVFKKGD